MPKMNPKYKKMTNNIHKICEYEKKCSIFAPNLQIVWK